MSTAQELRKPVYRTVAARAVDYDKILGMMASVRWDIRDIMSQHSHYVDVLLQVCAAVCVVGEPLGLSVCLQLSMFVYLYVCLLLCTWVILLNWVLHI